MERGNLLISFLFADGETVISNINHQYDMMNDLQKIAEEWKDKGYIKRYMIADDDVISEKLKNIEIKNE